MVGRILDISWRALRRIRMPSFWSIATIAIALPIALPLIAIFWSLLTPNSDVWQHLFENVLFDYVVNTVGLLLLVGCLTSLIGVGCAWLTATYDFFGRGMLSWLLILPLAAPAYVVAYAYADILSYTSPLQIWLRDTGLMQLGIPAIRSLWGAGLVLSFTLYPYVYLLTYNAFAEQAGPITEVARTLGCSRRARFFKIALPHARPAIAGGLALALMEAAADFGVVDFFGVPTLTNGIFRTWYAMGEHQAAMQLAGVLFLVVVVLVVFEQLVRRGRHSNPVSRNVPTHRTRLQSWHNILAASACAIPLFLGLIVPVLVLVHHAVTAGDPTFGAKFAQFVGNSLLVASLAAVLVVVCAVTLSYAVRLGGDRWPLKISVRVATLGYAVPGMVLAVGLITPLSTIDRSLARWFEGVFNWDVGLVLTGTIVTLILVYMARFMTVAFNSVDGGLSRIHTNYDDAARVLGTAPNQVMRRVHLPMLLPAVLTATLLVFVDVVKELPATLVLRPFNFETLATRAYRLASDERIAEASTACVLIVLLGLLPTFLLAMQNFGLRERQSQSAFTK